MTVLGRSPPPVVGGVFVSTFSTLTGTSLCVLAGLGTVSRGSELTEGFGVFTTAGFFTAFLPSEADWADWADCFFVSITLGALTGSRTD